MFVPSSSLFIGLVNKTKLIQSNTLSVTRFCSCDLFHHFNFSSPMDSKEDNASNLRVESFSCYLTKSSEAERFMVNLMGSVEDPVSKEIPCPINFIGRTKNNEGELSIFGADKYFNMKMEYPTKGKKENSKHGTPSACSEASTWNSRHSQTGLLQNRQKIPSPSKSKKKLFPIFGSCTGPCLSTKSVYIDEVKQSQKEQFAFPVLKPPERKLSDEIPRISLEVFGSSESRKGHMARNLERKLSMLTWDAIPKPQLTTALGNASVCDDMASDASSDLFEIENISGSGYSLLTRQASENMSSCMSPNTQYAPSEASIEWSIVTASAAGFSSVASEYTDKNVSTKYVKVKEAQKARPAGILGCRSYKSVRVAESAFKAAEKTKIPGADPFVSLKGPFAPRGFSSNV